jgi:hypothetical protein
VGPTLQPVTEYADPDLETVAPLPPLPPAPTAEPSVGPSGRGPVVSVVAALVVVSLVVGFGVATLVLNARDTGSPVAAGPAPTTPPSTPGATAPATTAPRVPADPNENVLGSLILRQSEVPTTDTVQLLQHGADLTIATLDLCNGTYPSEVLRTARRQVALTDAGSLLQMSTEAVLYRDVKAGEQAFGELQSVAAACPSTPVVSPANEDTATTVFRPAPDKKWVRTPSVERLAYDFVATSASTGLPQHSVAVYLRRGRALIGLYFSNPDAPQHRVAGRSTIAGIVGLFESRLAAVPARDIGA